MEDRLAPEQYDSLPEVPEPAEQTMPVLGHHNVIDYFCSAYRAGSLPHGIILAGERGIGKATLAFQFARYLFANPEPATAPATFGKPDPESAVFRQVASNAHHGLLHLTRPFDEKQKVFRSALTVEEIRTIARFVSLTSHDGGYRVVIVDSADDMNTNAANALLKNLEEPPDRTVFILISHLPGRLLPTIRSRCQMVRMQPLSHGDIEHVLDRLPDGGVLPAQRQDAIARCEGSVRNAILLTQFGGLEIMEAICATVQAPRFNFSDAQKISDAVSGKGKDVQFDLFNQSVADFAAQRSRSAAASGFGAEANRWSGLWQDVRQNIAETIAYNLDRKQHVLGLLTNLHKSVSQMGGLAS